jgi:uncharacterized LabA/DUF88 family protein
MAPAGLLFRFMREEPHSKRAVAFYDGQNLYHHAKAAFSHYHPNYDPLKLFNAVCRTQGWEQSGVRFYTGIPASNKDAFWHGFWSRKLLAMRRSGILVIHRTLKYQQIKAYDENGVENVLEVGQEKGIDVRLALDVIRLTLSNQLDVAVIFSQDQDLSEVVEDVREISKTQNRWIKVASAFPIGPNASAVRGINNTDWIPLDRNLYDACLDSRDYRPAI